MRTCMNSFFFVGVFSVLRRGSRLVPWRAILARLCKDEPNGLVLNVFHLGKYRAKLIWMVLAMIACELLSSATSEGSAHAVIVHWRSRHEFFCSVATKN